MIRNDLISKPSLLPSEVPGTDRSCLQGPRPAQDTPHMGVCCPCRQHAESRCASRGCAESRVCTRSPWPWRAETTGAAVGQGASAVEKRRGAGGRGGWGEVSGTKGEGDPREGGGAGRATQDPGCPGRGGPCLLGLRAWRPRSDSCLKATCRNAGAGDQSPARSQGRNPRSTGRASAIEASSEPNPRTGKC